MQLAVHFTGGPQQAHGVLRHFQAADRYTTGVGCLARGEQNASLDKDIHSRQGGRHVGAFGHAQAAIAQQRFGVFGIQFVLGGARQGDIARQAPWRATGTELQAETLGQLADATALDVLERHHCLPLLFSQAGFAVQSAFGVGQGDHFAAQVHDLACGILGHVAGTGDGHSLAFDVLAAALEHFFGEIHTAKARGFRTNQAAAIVHALTGQY
ncbi:hypothetical protein D9M71_553130 [compost metagenome]